MLKSVWDKYQNHIIFIGGSLIGIILLFSVASIIMGKKSQDSQAIVTPTPEEYPTITQEPTPTEPRAAPTIKKKTPTKTPTPTPTQSTSDPTNTPTLTPTNNPAATSTPAPQATATPTPVTFTVTKVTISVDPSNATGSCPKLFTFTAKITTNGAGTVKYKWVKKDGASSDELSATVNSAGDHSVTTTWELNSSTNSNWQKIQLLTPIGIESDQAVFSLTC